MDAPISPSRDPVSRTAYAIRHQRPDSGTGAGGRRTVYSSMSRRSSTDLGRRGGRSECSPLTTSSLAPACEAGGIWRRRDCAGHRFGPHALNLVFRVNGRVGERLVYRGEEVLSSFWRQAEPMASTRTAAAAPRFRGLPSPVGHLFDPYLAVSASQIEALPHQITAVYGEMLPRQPLRFLLADDRAPAKRLWPDC